MKHKDIYKWFELYAGDNVAAWFPNGKNSIRIRQTNGQEFIFIYNSQKIGGFYNHEFDNAGRKDL